MYVLWWGYSVWVGVCVYMYVCACGCVEVTEINRFTNHDADMPEGWEKKLNKEGRVSHMT